MHTLTMAVSQIESHSIFFGVSCLIFLLPAGLHFLSGSTPLDLMLLQHNPHTLSFWLHSWQRQGVHRIKCQLVLLCFLCVSQDRILSGNMQQAIILWTQEWWQGRCDSWHGFKGGGGGGQRRAQGESKFGGEGKKTLTFTDLEPCMSV